MNFNLVKLVKEHDLNKLIRQQKKNKGNLNILFVSPWDDYCNTLLYTLEMNSDGNADPLYVVDSYMMPHSFVIYKTTKLPHLVRLKGNDVIQEDYLPRIYRYFSLEPVTKLVR